MPLNKDDGIVWIQFGQIFSASVLQNYNPKCHANYRLYQMHLFSLIL